MQRLLICASPRTDGRSSALASQIFESLLEECPQDGVRVLSLPALDIHPCIGCDACERALDADSDRVPSLPDPEDSEFPVRLVRKSDSARHRCVFEDSMEYVRRFMDSSDEVIVVCPVYFCGAPSQAKAMLDRLQPYFWSNLWRRTDKRRPLELHIVGEGGNPKGHTALVDEVSAAFAVAGFRLARLLDWTGRISAEGEIMEDAEEAVFDLDAQSSGEDA